MTARQMRTTAFVAGFIILLASIGVAIHEHILPIVGSVLIAVKAAAIALIKKVGTRAFLESIPLFMGKWTLKAGFKFVFIQIPMTLAVPYVMVRFLKPRTRVRIRLYLRGLKANFLDQFGSIIGWFERTLGVNGWLSFGLSAIAAVAMLIATYVYFDGFAFFAWLGSWGPLAPFWSWLGGWLSWMGNGLIYRFPAIGRILAWGIGIWVNMIAPRFPRLAARHRLFVKQSLRHAQRNREVWMDRRERVLLRWRRRQKRRKQMVKERKEKQQMRFIWTSGAKPMWERRFWTPDIYQRMLDRAMHESSDRLYCRSILGADIHRGLLEGGHTNWRVARRH